MNCPMWDEYNDQCMWERLEKIFCFEWEKEVIEECFEEMA